MKKNTIYEHVYPKNKFSIFQFFEHKWENMMIISDRGVIKYSKLENEKCALFTNYIIF